MTHENTFYLSWLRIRTRQMVFSEGVAVPNMADLFVRIFVILPADVRQVCDRLCCLNKTIGNGYYQGT